LVFAVLISSNSTYFSAGIFESSALSLQKQASLIYLNQKGKAMLEMTAEEATEWGKSLNFEKVWAVFMETDHKFAEFAQKQAEVAEQFKETDRKLAEATEQIKEVG
jgi:predicted transcriptional regulator